MSIPGPCGETGDFSHLAYNTATLLYGHEDIERVAERAEAGIRVKPEVLSFFHDLAVHQGELHPDWDSAIALDTLALRIDCARGLVGQEILKQYTDGVA
ncbi:MAG TPA: hypothetical protein VMR34_01290 [Candidatus Saccharimonadales bacterium]|nr:hypothetical protein [Candidatus Saccharimonadales bacterium]